MPQPGASLLSYPAAIPLSNRTLVRLADLIRAHRAERRSRWRRLNPGQQALLVLAHLRNGDTYARLAAGFAIGTTTAWRYVRESVDLLAALAVDVHAAVARAARLAYVILDGTLIPIDRVADQKPYYSGKHKRHGMNVQVLGDPAGRLVWASPALPGAVHDLTAARTVGLIDALTGADVMTFADKGYQGAGGTIRTPFKRAGTGHGCRAARRTSIARTPVSAPSANELSPSSKPGSSSRGSAAALTAPLRSCRPSSSCKPSKTTATQDEKGSLYAVDPPRSGSRPGTEGQGRPRVYVNLVAVPRSSDAIDHGRA
ncbi:transposase IS493 [Microbispora sp. ATCC PTA-5024]|nr:transposase IS493 [Microbispora sp. ATCC PTA-5024]